MEEEERGQALQAAGYGTSLEESADPATIFAVEVEEEEGSKAAQGLVRDEGK
jgi:hypothetical protein